MNAKTIVNRLLEDYDPDLDEVSPESVSNSVNLTRGFTFASTVGARSPGNGGRPLNVWVYELIGDDLKEIGHR